MSEFSLNFLFSNNTKTMMTILILKWFLGVFMPISLKVLSLLLVAPHYFLEKTLRFTKTMSLSFYSAIFRDLVLFKK